MTEESTTNETIWVLTEERGGDLAQYAGPLEIGVEKLKEHMEKFSNSVSKVIASVQDLAGEYELGEITLKVSLSAEKGFVLVSQAGVEGAIELKFTKKEKKQKS